MDNIYVIVYRVPSGATFNLHAYKNKDTAVEDFEMYAHRHLGEFSPDDVENDPDYENLPYIEIEGKGSMFVENVSFEEG